MFQAKIFKNLYKVEVVGIFHPNSKKKFFKNKRKLKVTYLLFTLHLIYNWIVSIFDDELANNF